MARSRARYSEAFKLHAVSLATAEPDRIPAIARELDLDLSLLYRWRRQYASPLLEAEGSGVRATAQRPGGEAGSVAGAEADDGLGVASDPRLRQSLLETAFALNAAIRESTASAPLNQLSAALGLIIDRLLKLEALTSGADNAPDSVDAIRIEYSYPDGSVHSRPPWAADDPAFDLPVVRGHVRSPFWESRDAEQADDPGAGPAPA